MDLALFDFDGTITRHDSFVTFLRFALSRRRMFFGKLVLAPLILGYRLGVIPASRVRTAIAWVGFQGARAERVHDAGERFVKERIPQFLRDNAMARLTWHKKRGDRVVVVSAALDIYLAKWCEHHGVEWICTELEEKQGKLTGRQLGGGDCSGEEKRRRILRRYKVNEYKTIYAYGDTHEDGPMLALADEKFFRWQPSDGTKLDTEHPPPADD